MKLNVKKIVVISVAIGFIGKGLGFVRELMMASSFGTSPITDAYYIAILVPVICLGFIKSFPLVYTPVYVELLETDSKKKAKLYTKTIVEIIFLLSVVVISIIEVFLPQIIQFFAPGYTGDTLYYTITFSRISIFSGLISALLEFYSANLRCHDHFISLALVGLIVSPIECLFIMLAKRIDNVLLIFGPIIGEIIQLVIVLACFYKANTQFRNIDTRVENVSKEIRESFILLIPIFISSMVSQINTYFDSMFGSMLPSGSVTSLNYASKIFTMIFALLFSTVSVTLFPILAKLAAGDDYGKLKNTFLEIINYLLILSIPLTMFSILLRNEIVSVIYERGSFGGEMTIVTAYSFAAYMIGITALGIQEVTNKLFYSIKKTNYSLVISGITVFLNFINNSIFIKIGGQTGLAFASSLSLLITIPIMFLLIRKSLGSLNIKKVLTTLLKVFVSCIGCLVIVKTIYSYVAFSSPFITLVVSLLLFVPIYVLLLYLVKTKEIVNLVHILKGKIAEK